MNKAVCPVCPHHCILSEGESGKCRARRNIGGKVIPINYGKLTALMLDPIEKKPLGFFYPGSKILSAGSYGCNLSCPFCQNHNIAMAGEEDFPELRKFSPEELCGLAKEASSMGNIGVAYTYNEPLTGYEFVRDTSELVHEAGMVNVLVTNGMAELTVLKELLPYIDAMNIDLKGFRLDIYERLGGDLETVKAFIIRAASGAHVELSSLIVPGMNDREEDMESQAAWIAAVNPEIPLHITRYFPRYKMNEPATDLALMRKLKSVAEHHLKHVRLGNV